jgi:glutamate-1-semialdehyde 2,1-aminomutase
MDQKLKERANTVLASLTHLSVKGMPSSFSQFYSSGKGSHVTDVNGKVWIDYLCSYGPVLLGHQHPKIEEAIINQRKLGDCLAGPSERMVELAEKMVKTIPFADWVYFAKNGSDATVISVRIARAMTKRKIILRAPHSYHGAASIWREGSNKSLAGEGVLQSEVQYLKPFTYNDLDSVVKAANEAGNDWAGIIVAAFQWDYGTPQQLATKEFLKGVRDLCSERGAAFICDDVRSSYRINSKGTWGDKRYGHGVSPDMTCLCKGIANGQPLSAVCGTNQWKEGASKIVATGSFWANSVPFAAALATIDLADDAAKSAERRGIQLRNGLQNQAKEFHLDDDFNQSGPPQMPYFNFTSENHLSLYKRIKILTFVDVCARGGILFHPFHTMFIGGSHSFQDIQDTLIVTRKAFASVANLQKPITTSKL